MEEMVFQFLKLFDTLLKWTDHHSIVMLLFATFCFIIILGQDGGVGEGQPF